MPVSGPEDLRARIDALVRVNIDDLLAYFQRRLLNNADAAEAVGELLFLTWKLRRRVPGDPTEGRMWLFATASNILRGTRRSLSRRSAAVARLVQDARTARSRLSRARDRLRVALDAPRRDTVGGRP